MAKLKPIPKFKNEDEEFEFWSTHAVTDYFDFTDPKARVEGEFVNLKPSTKTITLRVTESLLAGLKILANKRDVPYQSLMKMFLTEKVEQELYKGSKKMKAEPADDFNKYLKKRWGTSHL